MQKAVKTPATETLPAQSEPVNAPAHSMSGKVLDLLAKAAADPKVDVAKMEALLAVQERLLATQAREDYLAAFAAMQPELPSVGRDGAIIHNGKPISRYRTLDALDRAVRPILHRHGFNRTWQVQPGKAGVEVQCTLTHAHGHSERTGFLPVPQDTSGAKNAAQGMGSALKYGERYTLEMILDIPHEAPDNDARATGEVATPPGMDGDAVLREARHASEAGHYADWFKAQGNAVRGWLIDAGHHVQGKGFVS